MEENHKKKKKFGTIEKIILIIIILAALVGIFYKPFLEKFYIPHVHDKISQDTKLTPEKTYKNNMKHIKSQLKNQDKNGEMSNQFEYNKDPKKGSNLDYDLGKNKKNQLKSDKDNYNGDHDNSSKRSNSKNDFPDLSYDYSKVKPASELDLSTLNPNYDKRLLVGHINMPAIGIDLPILEGVSNANLYAGAATLKPYQKMGQGNYALASHYLPDQVSNFSKIGQLRKGNRIYTNDGKYVYEYSTSKVKNVPINSGHMINDVKGRKLITLVTCTDIYGHARTVVQGDYIGKHSINSKYGRYFK